MIILSIYDVIILSIYDPPDFKYYWPRLFLDNGNGPCEAQNFKLSLGSNPSFTVTLEALLHKLVSRLISSPHLHVYSSIFLLPVTLFFFPPYDQRPA